MHPGPVDRRAFLALGLGCGADAPAAQAGHEWRAWSQGRAVPALALPTLAGPPWRLAGQRGKVVVANFWATWCEPCRAEMPTLVQLAARHAGDGLVLAAVNHREAPATIIRYLQALGMNLPVLLDADGRATKAWTPGILPSTVLFRRSGRPAGVLVGEIDWLGAEAGAWLAPLLTET